MMIMRTRNDTIKTNTEVLSFSHNNYNNNNNNNNNNQQYHHPILKNQFQQKIPIVSTINNNNKNYTNWNEINNNHHHHNNTYGRNPYQKQYQQSKNTTTTNTIQHQVVVLFNIRIQLLQRSWKFIGILILILYITYYYLYDTNGTHIPTLFGNTNRRQDVNNKNNKNNVNLSSTTLHSSLSRRRQEQQQHDVIEHTNIQAQKLSLSSSLLRDDEYSKKGKVTTTTKISSNKQRSTGDETTSSACTDWWPDVSNPNGDDSDPIQSNQNGILIRRMDIIQAIMKYEQHTPNRFVEDDTDNGNNRIIRNTGTEDVRYGRERFVQLFHDANIQMSNLENSTAIFQLLPLWDDIEQLYYNIPQSLQQERHKQPDYDPFYRDSEHINNDKNNDNDDTTSRSERKSTKPIILGMETCTTFRTMNPLSSSSPRQIGIAGLYNTGTNLLYKYLQSNCQFRNEDGGDNKTRKMSNTTAILSQVPWGKYTPANDYYDARADSSSTRTGYHTDNVANNNNNVLPVVIIRDPYTWLQSLCHNPQYKEWVGDDGTQQRLLFDQVCPQLVVIRSTTMMGDNNEQQQQQQQQEQPQKVTMSFPKKFNGATTQKTQQQQQQQQQYNYHQWLSFIHLWNDWYHQYIQNNKSPRIIVRFEDLIYQPKELIREICSCAGAVPIDERKFQYSTKINKKGDDTTTNNNSKVDTTQIRFVASMIKNGNHQYRIKNMKDSDIQFVKAVIDTDLTDYFRYMIPSTIDEAQRGFPDDEEDSLLVSSSSFQSSQNLYQQQMELQPL